MQPYAAVLRAYFVRKHRQSFDKHEILLHAGTVCHDIYFLSSGFVRAYLITDDGESRIISIKGPGELVPLSTLFNPDATTIYYEAITPVTTYKAGLDDFQAAMENDAELAYAVLQTSLTVVREYQQRLENLEIKDARRRIVYRLLFLRRKFGEIADRGLQHVIGVPINYQDLADAVNISRETANRVVSKLVAEGVVEKRRNKVVLRDWSRLRNIIGH